MSFTHSSHNGMMEQTDTLFQTDFVQQLAKMGFDQSEVREALVAGLYQVDRITFREAHQLLNTQTPSETVTLLKNYGCRLDYDEDEFQQDIDRLDQHFDESNHS